MGTGVPVENPVMPLVAGLGIKHPAEYGFRMFMGPAHGERVIGRFSGNLWCCRIFITQPGGGGDQCLPAIGTLLQGVGDAGITLLQRLHAEVHVSGRLGHETAGDHDLAEVFIGPSPGFDPAGVEARPEVAAFKIFFFPPA